MLIKYCKNITVEHELGEYSSTTFGSGTRVTSINYYTILHPSLTPGIPKIR